jgi:hypothetical protein
LAAKDRKGWEFGLWLLGLLLCMWVVVHGFIRVVQWPGQIDPSWRAVVANHGRPQEWPLGTGRRNMRTATSHQGLTFLANIAREQRAKAGPRKERQQTARSGTRPMHLKLPIERSLRKASPAKTAACAAWQ